VPKAKKLKVYRTPIGFHDAYVAAPSQKAALEAWGSDANLFARGIAEEVTDEKLTAEPLASPGKVIKRSRGGMAEQIAALPPDQKPTKRPAAAKAPQLKPEKPPPSRAALEAAEEALAASTARHANELVELKQREVALQKERQRIEASHAAEQEKLEAAELKARRAYERAVQDWQGS
jgi:hypothetical protein